MIPSTPRVPVAVRVLLVLLGLGVASAPAGARKTAPVSAAAKAHFKQGRAFQEAGAWKDAIAEYEKAHVLAPLPELLYNVAQCHRLGGDKPQAIAAYQRYLQAAPEGSFADEARGHIAALKLRLQVEAAEAAKLRAEAEAEAARRRAREMEEAKGKAAEEAYRRLLRDQAERERKAKEATEAARRAAVEQAERLRVAEAEYRREVKAQRKVGRPLRAVGIVLQVVGPLFTIPGGLLVAGYYGKLDELKQWDRTGTAWSRDLDADQKKLRDMRNLCVGAFVTAGVILGTGIALHVIGNVRRWRAERAVPRPVVLPWVGPGGGGLAIEGRY